ncbi:hypothetical protein ACWEOR_30255, partial [Micromonospora chalcea]
RPQLTAVLVGQVGDALATGVDQRTVQFLDLPRPGGRRGAPAGRGVRGGAQLRRRHPHDQRADHRLPAFRRLTERSYPALVGVGSADRDPRRGQIRVLFAP